MVRDAGSHRGRVKQADDRPRIDLHSGRPTSSLVSYFLVPGD